MEFHRFALLFDKIAQEVLEAGSRSDTFMSTQGTGYLSSSRELKGVPYVLAYLFWEIYSHLLLTRSLIWDVLFSVFNRIG